MYFIYFSMYICTCSLFNIYIYTYISITCLLTLSLSLSLSVEYCRKQIPENADIIDLTENVLPGK